MIIKNIRDRIGIVLLFVALFITFIYIWNHSYEKGQEDAYVPVNIKDKFSVIPSEANVFSKHTNNNPYLNMPFDEKHFRTLETYYDNRAYHGAPPTIPHPIVEKQNVGGNDCLKCHENGGWVEKYKAYTPVTPHPELVNCKQCHVPVLTKKLFVANSFPKAKGPKVGKNNALLTSPPVIPHQLGLRNNCLSCHGGPSSPKEIRVSHPERTNCKQCHVPSTDELVKLPIFKRTDKLVKLSGFKIESPIFKRKKDETK